MGGLLRHRRHLNLEDQHTRLVQGNIRERENMRDKK